jgi:hypothetical protein
VEILLNKRNSIASAIKATTIIAVIMNSKELR